MPSKKQSMERKENFSSIVNYLREKGASDRKTISRELKLSWGCVSELTAMLCEKKVLVEKTDAKSNTRGKKSGILHLNPDVVFLGIDINKCGLKGCICNLLGEKKESFSSELLCDTKENFVTSIMKFTSFFIKKYPNITGIGFAMQGIFDKKSNVWKFPSDNGDILIDFKKDFEDKLSVPIVVEHDPDCILYGCLDYGKSNSMVVRIDSGIGAAIYRENAFLKNEPLEIGYTVLNDKGERLHDVFSQKKLKKILSDGNLKEKEEYFSNAGKYLGITLGNICNLLSLNKIYICGDTVKYYDDFKKSLEYYYEKTVLKEKKAETEVVNVTDAAYGALKIATDNFDWRG